MKKFMLLIAFLSSSFCLVQAQSIRDTLVVVPSNHGLYFYHVVTHEETIFSLSRKYHLDPKELADFNNLTLKSELKLFQLVKIPLNNENFNQSSSTGIAGLTPLFHKVLKGETLYHIGKIHDSVSLDLLQKWNKLSGNEVKTGQYLIVGWLREGGNNQLSNPAKDIVTKPSSNNIVNVGEKPVAASNISAPVQKNSSETVNNSGNSAGNNPDNNNNSFLNEVIASENTSHHIRKGNNDLSEDNAFSVQLPKKNTDVSKPVREKETAIIKKKVQSDNNFPEKKKQDNKAITVQNNPKPSEEKPDSFAMMLNQVTRVNQGPKAPSTTPVTRPENMQDSPTTTQAGGGTQVAVTEPVTSVSSTFEQEFNNQTNNGQNISSKKGAAGWFKSNVKQGSGKYYALCNDLPRGTVVEVINPLNQKSVLVKVLDVIPKGAENYNLIIKISDAAMGDLGVTQSRFWCEIQYPNRQ